MKTIFHTNVDGREIVTGFGEAAGLIDPVATYTKIGPALAQAPATAQMMAAHARIAGVRQQAQQALTLAEQARGRGDAQGMTRQNAEYRAKAVELEDLVVALTPVVLAFEGVRATLVAENAAYFTPQAGESLIDDAQAHEFGLKLAAAGPERRLQMDGTYVADLRGRVYYQKTGGGWARSQVQALGVTAPTHAIPEADLTDAQRQEIDDAAAAARVAALTPEARAAEREASLQAAVQRAAAMRSELEIAADPEALAKSQAWYAEAAAGIVALYK